MKAILGPFHAIRAHITLPNPLHIVEGEKERAERCTLDEHSWKYCEETKWKRDVSSLHFSSRLERKVNGEVHCGADDFLFVIFVGLAGPLEQNVLAQDPA